MTNLQPFTIKKRPPFSFLLAFLSRNLKDMLVPLKHPVVEKIQIDPKKIDVWMIGHATLLINLFGTTILTDPILVNWLPFLRRIVKAAFKPSELPEIDHLIISHAHLDHFNRRTLRQLAAKTKNIVVPKNCADLVAGMGFAKINELDWENEITDKDTKITAYRPEHWGQRYPWEKIVRGFNSYVIEKNGKSIFFAGDTGYGEFFKKIGLKHKIHGALLPIGAYSPSTFRKVHMNPEDALQAFADLKADHFIPMHWGSFRLSIEPMDEPGEFLARESQRNGNSEKIHILMNGQKYSFV